ncbi:MAG: gluconate 2-dehydrogenase subunit 3 family protein [Pyrinomonadaceae bacterium]|nr:gluconate 2-dehydrogenase subunit 3 family protein [Pyrinomonadaceae bacterium]
MSVEKSSEDKNTVSRRRALKVIGVGIGTATALPVLNNNALGQHQHHGGTAAVQNGVAKKQKAQAPKFFNAQEMAAISAMSELIIPTDDHSPGALAAEVPAFIDLMVSESPKEVKDLWREGLAAVDKTSQKKFSKNFVGATPQQQTELLTEISKNERKTAKEQTPEERFFRAIKNLTIDGYYTSEVGIHKDLQYKGNAYLKEFTGCTHPEHQA